MSFPEDTGSPGDDRHLTVIVVPHGDLETRSFVVSYTRLKVLVVAGVALLLLVAASLAFLFPIMAQAARVPGLERDLEELEAQRARVVELAQTLQEVEAQYERVRQLLGADAAGGDSVPVLPPLRNGAGPDSSDGDTGADGLLSLVDLWPLSTGGYVTRSLRDGGSRHAGLDIAVPQNTYIRAAGDGSVRAADVDDVYGHYVVLAHGGELETVYGHASRLLVSAGDQVRRGDVIGLTGSSGRSTAPHLHFEVRFRGRAVDPTRFVGRELNERGGTNGHLQQ
ncbi:MAG: M23 family metallopeptidase [Gemmatimonadota bacterium]